MAGRSDPIRLENDSYALEIEPAHGIVRRIADRKAGIELIAEPRLAENFRILLPLPDCQSNYILGSEQALTSREEVPGGVTLFWRGPLKNERGSFDLDVTIRVELVEQSVVFRCEVRNGTAHKIAEVWYAFVGGMKGLGTAAVERRETEVMLPTMNDAICPKMFSNFGSTRLGCLGAEDSFGYPSPLNMPWASLFNRRNGRAVYFAALEEAPRIKALRFALDPGISRSRRGGDWPRPDEAGDLPTGLTMNWVHFPYTAPGETFVSSAATLQCHKGGWQESCAIYRQWFDARFQAIPPGSTWMRRETACLDTMFILPEDNVNLTFRDIPAWARTARERGIGHVMISGWQVGGHDRGYPRYEPDPRLGTYEDLQEGIRRCHEMGLKVSFFVNCQPVDISTDWYKEELHKYRVLSPYGETYRLSGWGMGTLSARVGTTAAPLVEANPVHPEYRRMLIRYFRKLVEIGADGLHIDKFINACGVPLLDFNPRITWTSPDLALTEGALKFTEELLAECQAINPDFCISYEGSWDRLMPYSETSWWSAQDNTTDALRTVFPQRVVTSYTDQPYDYYRVNISVLNGVNLLIGPGTYTRGMDYAPMQKLCDYIAEVTRIRQELFDIVSIGEICDFHDGLLKAAIPTVSIGGPYAESKDGVWSVFRDPKTGRRALILGNMGADPLRAEGVRFTKGRGKTCRVYQAFEKTKESRMPLAIDVPAERVVFVVA